jgi:ribosomal protein S18 acetylase RimI-like enzyme
MDYGSKSYAKRDFGDLRTKSVYTCREIPTQDRPIWIQSIKQLQDVSLQVQYDQNFYDDLTTNEEILVIGVFSESSVLIGILTARRKELILPNSMSWYHYICWNLSIDSGYHSNCFYYDILTVAVDVNYRNQGVGRSLLSSFVRQVKQARTDHCKLHVLVSNEVAQSLYFSFGFEISASSKNHYYFEDKFHDAYEMTLKLNYSW